MAPRPFALPAMSVLTALLVAACAAPASAPAPTAAPAKPTESTAPAGKPAAPAPAPVASPAAVARAPSAPAPGPASGLTHQSDTAADRAVGAPAAAAGSAAAPRAAAPGGPALAQAPQPQPAPAPTAGTIAPPKPAENQPSQTAPLPPVSMSNRMIIYTTSLTLLVKSVESAVRAVGDLATLHGGYVAGVENGSENSLPFSLIRIKVLPDRYQAAMSALRDGSLAVEVRDEKATTQDVTEEYSDVQTQLASLEASHRQLLDLLAKATTMDEVLKIQQQAAQVKLQIDRLRGRATALERLSELATITVRLQAAEAVLGRDFVAVRNQLRQAQAQYAALSINLRKARTDEETTKIRDQLAELQLQVDRSTARLNDLTQKAQAAGVVLPTPRADEVATAGTAEELPEQYVAARVTLRQAEVRQAEITRRLKLSLPPDEQDALRKELSQKILEINDVNAQLRRIQERANQLGTTLPTLTPEQEAALAGTTVEVSQPDPIRAIVTAWEASLTFLRGALAGLLGTVVFLWWAIPLLAILAALLARRGGLRPTWPARRAVAPAPAEPAPPAP